MQISVNWLRRWVDIGSDVSVLADSLTEAGLETSQVQQVGSLAATIVVGEIIEVERQAKHNNLSICKVDVGRKRLLSIICGAANVGAGIKVPIALPGSILPDGTKISRQIIHGVTSSGIICSGEEIGIEETSEGVYRLDDTANTGASINEYLDLDDSIMELELTPNRGDCLSVIGLAREIAVLKGERLEIPVFKKRSTKIDATISVSVSANQDAPRYVGRIIEGLDPTSKTPDWMKEMLRRSGLRSLGPIIDVTNFVMLELGQPLHAFDLSSIKNHIEVRYANEGEKLVLLDGTRLRLHSQTLVIADCQRPIGLAGIMGGANSAVSKKTDAIFLEAGFFCPSIVAHGARTYNLQTDASYRFERGVDPSQQRRAVIRASQLIGEICGGRSGEIYDFRDKQFLPARKNIVLRRKQLERILGSKLKTKDVDQALINLNMPPSKIGSGWQVRSPDYRFDIGGEHDLIEEIARVYGFSKIPNAMPTGHQSSQFAKEALLPLSRIEDYLVDHGYSEVITYSFVDSELQKHIDPKLQAVLLRNPIAANMDVMRTSLLAGILSSVSTNLRRQEHRIRLFETGRVFCRESKQIVERNQIAGAVCGPADPISWQSPGRVVDFFDIKGHVEGLLSLGATDSCYDFRVTNDPALHPGQSAEIWDDNRNIGRIGLLHPELQRKLDFDVDVYVFSLMLSAITDRSIPIYAGISRFPSVSRDISLTIADSYSAEEVGRVIRNAGGDLLKSAMLFDVYSGREIKNNHKSLSFSLTLQSSSSNLTDREVETVLNSIVTALNKIGGELRTAT